MRRIPLLSALVLSSALLAQPAHAIDWLKKAQEVIGGGEESGSSSGGNALLPGLSTNDIIAGLKDALRVGSERVVSQVGAQDGFNADPAIHIPLPQELQTVQSALRKVGLGSIADDVELKLNRGAEAAAPKAKALIWNAIEEMTLEDAKRIYEGPNDAATQYFMKVASDPLKAEIKPVIDSTLADVGAINAYDQMMSSYKSIPFVPDIKADLSAHATQLALQGIFHYLAKEEAAIRENPAKRTTEILTKVFGG